MAEPLENILQLSPAFEQRCRDKPKLRQRIIETTALFQDFCEQGSIWIDEASDDMDRIRSITEIKEPTQATICEWFTHQLQTNEGLIDLNAIGHDGLSTMQVLTFLSLPRKQVNLQTTLIRSAIQAGGDLNMPLKNGLSAFGYALDCTEINCTKIFMEHGASIVRALGSHHLSDDAPIGLHGMGFRDESIVRAEIKARLDKANGTAAPYLSGQKPWHEVNAKEMLYLANLDLHFEALKPIHWEGRAHKAVKLVATLPPCLQEELSLNLSHIIHRSNPAESNFVAECWHSGTINTAQKAPTK